MSLQAAGHFFYGLQVMHFGCESRGYKDMIHDSFLIFSYIGGIVLITHGFNAFSSYLVPTIFDSKFFSLFISGIYLGSGIILIEHFLLLRKANKSNDSIESMKEKIEKLNSEVCK